VERDGWRGRSVSYGGVIAGLLLVGTTTLRYWWWWGDEANQTPSTP